MEIEYLCFSVPNLGTTDNIVCENDSENTVWIKTKEQELMNQAEIKNICLIFDRSTKKFYLNGEETNIEGKIIFPRSHIKYEQELLENIEKQGGISIETKADYDKIIGWPNFIKPLHRKIVVTTYREFIQNAETYKTMFQKVFFKTAVKSGTHCPLKSFGTIEIEGQKFFYTNPSLFGIKADDIVFLSETFEAIEDSLNEMDCKEYRVFVVNHNLFSIARSYIDYETEIPEKVIAFAESQIKRISKIKEFPSSYVLDIGEIFINGKETMDLIECNPICSSGLEIKHHLVEEILKRKNKPKQFVKK